MTRVPDFEELYRRDTDPWQVASSFYEQRKLELVLAVLSRPRYERSWDPACGTGHLAARLSLRTGHVLATDVAAASIEITRRTCAGLANVIIRQTEVPGDGPPGEGPFDLVVISEFLYYLDERERAGLYDLMPSVCTEGAEVVSVHWRHHPHDAWLSGAAVQAELNDALRDRGWREGVRLEDPEFVLQSVRRGADDH